MKPETRGRTSTDFTATKRPEYSSQVVICSDNGCAIVTASAGGSSAIAALHSATANNTAATGMDERLERLSKSATATPDPPDHTSDLGNRDRRKLILVDA